MVKRSPQRRCTPRHARNGAPLVGQRPRSASAAAGRLSASAREGSSVASASSASSQRKQRKMEQKVASLQARNEQLQWEMARLRRAERRRVESQCRQVQAELEARVAERTRELQGTIRDLQTFSYGLSHDVRAPLRAIQSYVEVLTRLLGDKLGPRERAFIEHILQTAHRLDGLVQEVLNYSRLSSASLELNDVDLEGLVEQLLQDLPGMQEPQATVEVLKPLLPVRGQACFLTQCLANLLTNAIKFVRPGQKPHVRLFTRRQHGRVQVVCEDNGIGIAPENQQRIFGLFQRLHSVQHYAGTGIGLAIVQKAAERMGGQVGVQSRQGQGSCFWLELQAA